MNILKFSFLGVAIRNLKRKKFRTGVLISSIAFLVILLIFATTFTVSVSSGLRKASNRLGADLIIVPVGARGYAEEFLLESKNKSFYMSKDMIKRVREIEGIELLTSHTYVETILGLCCDISPTQVVAFDQGSDFIIKPWLQESLGRRLNKGEAIAGYMTAENLGLGLLDVERTIFDKKFKVVGVLESTGTGLDNALFMTGESLMEIIEGGKSPLKKGEISIIFARVKRGVDPNRVAMDIEGSIVDVDVVARKEMGSGLLSTLRDINRIFMVSIMTSTLLTVFIVWAIFSAMANERLREVGIMRAIGARESHIIRLFFIEVITIGSIGSIIGIIAGIYLSVFLSRGFALLRNISAPLSVAEYTLIILIAFLSGTVICVIGALLPIYRLKEIEPLMAIKEV